MDKFFNTVRGYPLRRTHDGILGGVCSGIAHRWGLNPILIRILFALGLLFGGLSFFIYGLLWLLVPTYPENKISLEQTLRGNPQGSTLVAGIMTFLGLVSISSLGHIAKALTIGLLMMLIPLLVVAFAVWAIIVWGSKKNRPQPPFDQTPGASSPYGNSYGVYENPAAPSSEGVAYDANTAWPSASDTPTEQSDYSQQNAYFAGNNNGYYSAPSPVNPTAPYEAAPKVAKVKTPAASGTYIASVVALALAIPAIVLLAGGTIGSALAAIGAGVVILGIGIAVAGARGLRATWLTVLAWLLAPLAAGALILGIATPSNMLKDPNYRTFVFTSSLADSNNTSSIFNTSTINISKDTSEQNADISAMISDMKFVLSDNEPVIFELNGYGELSIQNSMGWSVLNEDNKPVLSLDNQEMMKKASADKKAEKRKDEQKDREDAQSRGKEQAKLQDEQQPAQQAQHQGKQQPELQAQQPDKEQNEMQGNMRKSSLRIEIAGSMSVANPAAVKDPSKARHIRLDFTVGRIVIKDATALDPATHMGGPTSDRPAGLTPPPGAPNMTGDPNVQPDPNAPSTSGAPPAPGTPSAPTGTTAPVAPTAPQGTNEGGNK
ncbi:PspC domain-containing protein [Arcanobacterium bovis]|uniref:PspC domain-containing protein n=1 Tax=Arcanobacterium bovis TaxID=2529275 RepID=A0A4Q9V0J9_9ACTO|nr:PspC domain-containing protein [Arcanobacterium bovis]TBW22154.1 PspC domain-containing protein [Arcanobacterium bovis]